MAPAGDAALPELGPVGPKAHTLVLMRHGESTWNVENKFTGWVDVPLTAKGEVEATEAGKMLAAAGLTPGLAFTSYLQRAQRTLQLAMIAAKVDVPVVSAWQLNERHYGALTGLDKASLVDTVFLVPGPVLGVAARTSRVGGDI